MLDLFSDDEDEPEPAAAAPLMDEEAADDGDDNDGASYVLTIEIGLPDMAPAVDLAFLSIQTLIEALPASKASSPPQAAVRTAASDVPLPLQLWPSGLCRATFQSLPAILTETISVPTALCLREILIHPGRLMCLQQVRIFFGALTHSSTVPSQLFVRPAATNSLSPLILFFSQAHSPFSQPDQHS